MLRFAAPRVLRVRKNVRGYSNPSDEGTASAYNSRKYGCHLPSDNVSTPFQSLCGIPSGVFRCTDGETLGPGAEKCGYYRNPEYFSFHHMTFYDFHLCLRPCRKPSAVTGRKP